MSPGCLACLALLPIAASARAQTRPGRDLPFAAGELDEALRLRLDGPPCPGASLGIEQVLPGTVEIRCGDRRRFVQLGQARGVSAARLVALAAVELGLESRTARRAADETSAGQPSSPSWFADLDMAFLATVEAPVSAEVADPAHALAGIAVEATGRTFAGLRAFAQAGWQRSIDAKQVSREIVLRAGLVLRTRWFDVRLAGRGARYTLAKFEGDSTAPGWQAGVGGALSWRPRVGRAVLLVSAGLDEHLIRTNRQSCCVADAIRSDRTGWVALGLGW